MPAAPELGTARTLLPAQPSGHLQLFGAEPVLRPQRQEHAVPHRTERVLTAQQNAGGGGSMETSPT